MKKLKNIGVYIHYPFCSRKCFYCDFYSITELSLTEMFIDYLIKELEIFFSEHKSYEFIADTLFFGGGTPSILTPAHLKLIMASLEQYAKLSDNPEITVECNPGSRINQHLEGYLDAGINRLSIGVQSFNDDELKFLQRIHDSEQASNTIRTARLAGFGNINLDLIFSLPGQTKEKLGSSIDKALALETDHISAYSLIYEEGTPLHRGWSRGLINKNDDGYESELYFFLIDELAKSEYEQYEVSNFAKPGKKCRHNLNYWNSGEYLAFGPSAHGYLNGIRYGNVRDLRKYFEMIDNNDLPLDFTETISPKEELTETMLLSLRAEGLDVKKFDVKFNTDILFVCRKELEEYHSLGLIYPAGEKIRLTPRGYAVCDSICVKLIEVMEKVLIM